MSNPFLNPKQNIDKKHFNENRDRCRNRNNYNNNYNNRYSDNRFKSITPDNPKFDINNIKAFPALVNSKEEERDTIIHTSSNFKDILNIVIEEDIIENTDTILPGWLQLTMINGKVLKKEYEEIEDEQKIEQVIEDTVVDKEFNYNMYRIGKALQTNYELYEKDYDSINGEGSYDINFRLSPVYGSEYDSNSNSESEENIDEDDDEY